ncbi:MAG: LysR family transcriptional regulator [Myxococcota bacterium]
MSWDDLRYVLAVVRTETLSDAASALGVSVSTVSRRIAALEEEVGTALFEKVTRGAVLTVAGEKTLAVAEAMEALTNDLDAKIHGLDSSLEGTIRVTSTDTLAQHFIGDFRDFQQRHADIHLQLTSGHSVANLTQREADVAIRLARSAPEHLIGRKHAQVFYAVYGSPELVARVGPDAAYDDFPWLSWDLSVGRGNDIWLEHNAPNAVVVSRIERMPVMVDAVASGWGLMILPCFAGDVDPRIVRVGDYLEGGASVWILTHAALRTSARIMHFVRFAADLIKRDKDLIEGRRPATR